MALVEADNKKKVIKITIANDKKAARPQVEKVSDSEPVSAFDSKNE